MSAGPVGAHRSGLRAFTLAEVLVVVGLVALLAGLLLPALNRARSAAVRVRCVAALRQYGLANQMYVSEYRDWWLPVKWGFNPSPTPPATLPAGLAPATIAHQTYPNNVAFRRYLRGRDAGTGRVPAGLVCPRAVLVEEGANKAGYQLARSYGYNSTGLSWYGNPTVYYTGWKRRQVRSPGTKLMFVDATDWVVSLARSGRYEVYGEAHGAGPMNGITAYRHDRGANVAYWDGHVAWAPKGEIIGNASLWRSSH